MRQPTLRSRYQELGSLYSLHDLSRREQQLWHLRGGSCQRSCRAHPEHLRAVALARKAQVERRVAEQGRLPLRCTWAAATAAAAAAAVVDVALGPVGSDSGDILPCAEFRWWSPPDDDLLVPLLLPGRPSSSAGAGLRNGLFERLQFSLRRLFCSGRKANTPQGLL
uniref:Uncharacterized protein n=1 Tax=Anopheles atroparvus TaxID=41427 RepID=A0A182JKI1_ANOAO